jgi:hypothetical protein
MHYAGQLHRSTEPLLDPDDHRVGPDERLMTTS